MNVKLKHVGTATVIFEVGPIRFITDPCLDKSGQLYHHGWGAISKKTSSPSVSGNELKHLDFALITHGHHKDNLDISGLKLIHCINTVYSTFHTVDLINHGIGLSPGDFATYSKDGVTITIHAVSARHGVGPLAWFAGPVIGFVLEISEIRQLIYISGDTIYKDSIIDEIIKLGQTGLFLPHLGNTTFNYLSRRFRYTMNKNDLIHFLSRLQPQYTYPIHNKGWSHFNPINLDTISKTKYCDSIIRTKNSEFQVALI